jgi:hypothetical protein
VKKGKWKLKETITRNKELVVSDHDLEEEDDSSTFFFPFFPFIK